MEIKRRLLLPLLLVFLPILTISAQTKNEELERQRLADNKIKTVTQWTHRYSGGKLNEQGYKTTETQYDKNGNPIEILSYRASGEISSRVQYKYNSNNQRTEYVMYQRKMNDTKLSVTYKQNINYNPKGNKAVEVIFDGASSHRIVYQYTSNDDLKEIVKYGAGNVVDERWIYDYEGNSQIISVYKPEGRLDSKVTKTFDANGNLLGEFRVDAKGNELKKSESKFDSKNREIERSEFYAGKLLKRLQYAYNDDDFLLEIVQHNPDGTKFTQSKYNYDTKGNLLEEQWSEAQKDEFSRKQSTYDGQGKLVSTDQYLAPYSYRVLYRYSYGHF